MAIQSVLNPFLGLGNISESTFIAGLLSMLIHLDRDSYNGKRTPILHSTLFAVAWSLLFAFTMSFAQLGMYSALTLSAFASHILTDAFTEEGVFMFPKSLKPKDWFKRRPNPENSWVYWNRYSLSKRSNDDPLVNLSISAASVLVLIALLALTPL